MFVSFKILKPFSILLFFLLMVCSGFATGNNDTYDSLNIIYIDNSKINANDGLSAGQVRRVIALNDSLATLQKEKYFLFASSGSSPFISNSAAKSVDYLKKLYSSQTSFPEINSDIQQLRETLFKTPFKLVKQLNISYFLTDNMCTSSDYEMSKLFCSFAQEISMMTEFAGNIEVTVYYSNLTGKVQVENIEKNMCFYNSKGEIKPKISFNAVRLQ